MKKSDLFLRITGLLSGGSTSEAEGLITGHREELSAPEYDECLGNVHFYRKEFQRAIPYYEAAMKSQADYDCARYHYLLGVQAERVDRMVEAFKRYQAAIEIEPTFVDSYVELGGLLTKIEDFEGALQCYTDALALDPNDLALYHNLVFVLSRLYEKEPATYAQRHLDALYAYETAKKSLAKPRSDRVW